MRPGSEDNYVKGARQGFLSSSSSLDMQVESAKLVQREPSPPTEEDSDIAMDEEPEDEDDCFPSIESLYPSPRQSITSQCPRVEYFDPTNQQWTQSSLPETSAVNPVDHHPQQSIRVPPSSVTMSDDDVDVFMSELDSTVC